MILIIAHVAAVAKLCRDDTQYFGRNRAAQPRRSVFWPVDGIGAACPAACIFFRRGRALTLSEPGTSEAWENSLSLSALRDDYLPFSSRRAYSVGGDDRRCWAGRTLRKREAVKRQMLLRIRRREEGVALSR